LYVEKFANDERRESAIFYVAVQDAKLDYGFGP